MLLYKHAHTHTRTQHANKAADSSGGDIHYPANRWPVTAAVAIATTTAFCVPHLPPAGNLLPSTLICVFLLILLFL